nr:MAG TPA_asm: portal protein [Caudoviricetes sp.]
MSALPIVTEATPMTEKAIGGGLEGASRQSRELMTWHTPVISPDQQINPNKDIADARGRDSLQNDGYALGAMHTHRDSIVGTNFRLNAQPVAEVLGADDAWTEEFQQVVESRFNLLADSEDCWFDASRKNTLTGLVRLAVGGHMMTGEVLATAEWLRGMDRPFSTAIQMVSPTRLCNPDGKPDERFLRRGVETNLWGEAVSYWFRLGHPNEPYGDGAAYRWRNVPARKPWGRLQVIHIVEQMQPDQTRGIADMVSVLKQMRMTKRFQDVVLQNAVVNATYAAAIESELPSEVVYAAMGAGGSGLQAALQQYMGAMAEYANTSNKIQVDGVKMPHLFPGTKLALKPMGTPGGVGTDFEQALLRHTAAALGLSYEQFSKDYTKTNYSSARASMGETWKYMQGRKKVVADRFANLIYRLWFEEELNAGNIPLPRGMTVADFYTDPVKREALVCADWIGASRGQIDEMKETQAAVERIKAGLSTLEKECARLGEDYRRVLKQRAREDRMVKSLGLDALTSDRMSGTMPAPAAEPAQQQGDGGDAAGSNE